MKEVLPYILALALLPVAASCSFEDEPGVCPYNVRLEYWYAGYATENRLPVRMDNLQEYLYDGGGRLVRTCDLRRDNLTGYHCTLVPGEYTVVVWGNLDTGGNGATCVSFADPLPAAALTALRDTVPPGWRENTGRLYYGSAAFTVPASGVMSRRIYVSHAHASLTVTVSWNTDRPRLDGPLTMRLRGIPGCYGFSAGREIPSLNAAGPHQVPAMDLHETRHAVRATADYAGDVSGEFVTFRYTNATHQWWSLWCGGRQVIRELDLSRFFARSSVDMDHNVEQEFHLLVLVEADHIVVTEISGTDWEEGGVIG